nr:lipopolysaccharide heptosyltransferase II [uncultured bacterium]
MPLDRRWVLIHPGASAPSRRYPGEHFALAADELVEEHGFEVLFVCGAGEQDLLDEIAAQMRQPCRIVKEDLNFGQLAALIRRAPLLIANNSGPVHIAAAVGTPVVDLYALTNPQHTPWLVPHRLLTHQTPCAYCYKSVCPERHHECLRGIEPAQVVRAAVSLCAETNGHRSTVEWKCESHFAGVT